MINTFDTHTILHNPEREKPPPPPPPPPSGGERQTDQSRLLAKGRKLQRCGLNRGFDTDVIHSEAPDNAVHIPNDTCRGGVSLTALSAPPFLQHYPPLSALLLQVHARPSNNRRSRTIVLPIKPIYNRNSAPALLFSSMLWPVSAINRVKKQVRRLSKCVGGRRHICWTLLHKAELLPACTVQTLP